MRAPMFPGPVDGLVRRQRDMTKEKTVTEQIKCCPFCGSHDVEVNRTNAQACWIQCADCGAEAETHPTRSGAIANWNRRHYDDTPAVVVEDTDVL